MRPLIILRPQPGCAATMARARAAGLEAHGWPLFAIEPRDWALPEQACDALLIGSANALHCGGAQLAKLRGLPAYAVGESTAQAARAAGLEVIATGSGGLQGLLARLDPAHRRLLRLTGEERVALALPGGVTMAERVVYAAVPQAMPPGLATLLERPLCAALHSAAAARHFAALCPASARPQVRLACLGPRIADAALTDTDGTGWQAVDSAATPDDAALLALAARMCQD